MAAAIAKSVRCVFTSSPLQASARRRASHKTIVRLLEERLSRGNSKFYFTIASNRHQFCNLSRTHMVTAECGLAIGFKAVKAVAFHQHVIDSRLFLHQVGVVGLDRSRPVPKAYRPSTALRPLAGPRALAECQISIRPEFGSGIGASNVKRHSVWIPAQHLREGSRADPDCKRRPLHLPQHRRRDVPADPSATASVRARSGAAAW